VNSPSPRGLLRYAAQCLGLEKYLRQPGDGRPQPRIAARTLLWSMLIARLLREISFHAVEQLVHSCCRAVCVPQSFGDDALGYFTERLDPAVTRAALIGVLHRAKRNKAFQDSRFVGLAIDGTTAGHSTHRGCGFCRPQHNAKKEVIGYSHQMVSISVVGTGLSLPFDAEPYGAGDSEYASSSSTLIARACRLSDTSRPANIRNRCRSGWTLFSPSMAGILAVDHGSRASPPHLD